MRTAVVVATENASAYTTHSIDEMNSHLGDQMGNMADNLAATFQNANAEIGNVFIAVGSRIIDGLNKVGSHIATAVSSTGIMTVRNLSGALRGMSGSMRGMTFGGNVTTEVSGFSRRESLPMAAELGRDEFIKQYVAYIQKRMNEELEAATSDEDRADITHRAKGAYYEAFGYQGTGREMDFEKLNNVRYEKLLDAVENKLDMLATPEYQTTDLFDVNTRIADQDAEHYELF